MFSLSCLFIPHKHDHCDGCSFGYPAKIHPWPLLRFNWILLHSNFHRGMVFERVGLQFHVRLYIYVCGLNSLIFRDIGSGAADLCKQQPNLARFKLTMRESV